VLVELEDRSVPTTFTWLGANSLDWNLGTNWDQGAAPDTGADVVINNGTTPVYNTTVEINTLSVGSTSGLALIGGTLTIDAASTVGGLLAINNGVVTANAALHVIGNMNQIGDGSTMNGSGDVTIDGLFTWSSGSQIGPGRTIANGGMFSDGSITLKDFRRFDNKGTATLTGARSLTFQNGAVFNNNGIYDLQGDSSISVGFPAGADSVFNNVGTLKKTGTNGIQPSTIGVPFNNTGRVDLQTDTVIFRGTGTSTGPWTVAANATLEFAGGAWTMNTGSTVTGDGRSVFLGNLPVDFADTYSIANTEFQNSGTANFNVASSTTTLTFGGGDANILGGSADFTVNGLLTWGTGFVTGTGSNTLFANGDIALVRSAKLDHRHLDLASNHTLTCMPSSFGMSFSNGAEFNNFGTFDVQADAGITNSGAGAPSVFNNFGTFKKSGGTGVTVVQVLFDNAGVLDEQTGTLNMIGGLTNFPAASTAQIATATESGTTVTITTPQGHQSVLVGQQVTISGVTEDGYNGTFIVTAVPSMTTFQYTAPPDLPDSANGAASFLSTSTLTGGTYLISGTLQVRGGTVVTNAATIVLNGPTSAFLNESTGASALANFATNAAGGSFTIQSGRNFTTAGGLGNAGSVTVGGGSTLTVGGGNNYTQTAGTTALDGTLVAAAADVRGGRLEGSGTVTGDLTNAARVRLGGSPGLLTINGGYTQTNAGSLDAEVGGPAAGTQFDQLVVTGPAALDGTLNVTLLGGFVPAGPDAFRTVSAGSRTGTFATLTGSAFPGGRFALLYDATGALLDANLATTPADDADTTVEGHAVTTDVVANDGDPDGDALAVVAVADSAQGVTPVNNGDGTVTYDPPAGFVGTDAFTYTVRDAVGNEATANVTITVTPVNTAPTLDPIPDPAAIPEDAGAQTVNLTGISTGSGEVQSLAVTATSSNPGLVPDPTVAYASPDDTGSLHYTPVPNQSGTAVITVTVRDDGGTAFGGIDELTRTFTVTVDAVPDAPAIETSLVPMLPPVPLRPAPTNPAGAPVADLLAGVTEADGDPLGLAVTAVDDRKGAWQFSVNGGSTWNPVPTSVSATAALVLTADAGTRVRFLPNRGSQGLASLSFRAWDRSDGTAAGTQVDPTLAPTAYSAATERAWVAVGRTSPAVNAAGATVLAAVREDSKASRVFAVKGLLGIAGLESPTANPGIAITGLSTTNGRWQFRLAGARAFVDVGAVSEASALLLRPTDVVRFVTAANADGQDALTFKTWDQAGAAGAKADTAGPGFGTDPGSAAIDVITVNDAPVLDLSVPAVLRPVDPGQTTDEPTFAALMAAADVDGPATGVAVVAARGRGWEFNAGGGWTPLGAVSSLKALLLATDAQIRLVAPADARPGTATLSFKAWDRSPGSGAVGARVPVRGTAFSKLTEVATVAIANVAPALDTTRDVTLPTVVSDSTRPIAGTAVKSLLGSAVTDAAGSLRGVAVVFADGANGTWQYSLGGGVFLDVGSVGPGSALLLAAANKLRFVPNAGFTGPATIEFQAWDRTTGQAGDRIDTGPPLNSFSTEVETATVTVV
jgi:hypothetical protein